MQVSSNGVLSFQRPLPHVFSVPFPLEDDAIIALFWSNRDIEREQHIIRRGVFYQYSTEESLLQRVGAMVDDFDCCFKPKLLFIVTWLRILQDQNDPYLSLVRNYTLLI